MPILFKNLVDYLHKEMPNLKISNKAEIVFTTAFWMVIYCKHIFTSSAINGQFFYLCRFLQTLFSDLRRRFFKKHVTPSLPASTRVSSVSSTKRPSSTCSTLTFRITSSETSALSTKRSTVEQGKPNMTRRLLLNSHAIAFAGASVISSEL